MSTWPHYRLCFTDLWTIQFNGSLFDLQRHLRENADEGRTLAHAFRDGKQVKIFSDGQRTSVVAVTQESGGES
jgi:hypothetical protein